MKEITCRARSMRRFTGLTRLGLVGSIALGACYQPSNDIEDFGGYQGNAVSSYDDAGTTNGNGADGTGAPPRSGSSSASGGAGSGSSGSSGGAGSAGGGASGGGVSELDAGALDSGVVTPGDPGTTPGGGGAGGGGGGTPALTTLSFSVSTVSLGGRYSPRNIGAIWIEDASGNYVKTLAEWARTRERYLTNFLAASGGDTTDAVTSATLTQHTTHDVSWNLTDRSGNTVPDGDYRVVMELTDQNSTGDTHSVSFTKGPSPVSLTPPDAAHFTNMSLRLE